MLRQSLCQQMPQFILTVQSRIEVVPQILAVVIGGYIVDMYLVTFLEYTQHTHFE